MKNTFLRRLSCLSIFSLFIMAGTCAGDSFEKSNKSKLTPVVPNSATLLIKIQSEIGDATCDEQQQCHSIAIGAKPCGGPDSYLAWSSKRTNEKNLTSLVTQHATARRQENLSNDMQSDCAFVSNPGVSCKNGRCTLLQRGFGSRPERED